MTKFKFFSFLFFLGMAALYFSGEVFPFYTFFHWSIIMILGLLILFMVRMVENYS